jgi:hypothetical protein
LFFGKRKETGPSEKTYDKLKELSRPGSLSSHLLQQTLMMRLKDVSVVEDGRRKEPGPLDV